MKEKVPRFRLDDDNDIVDNDKLNIYAFRSQKDWEKILILLNTLELQKQNMINEKDNIITCIKNIYEEYNNNIDEYSLMKIDIIESIAEELNIELE